MLIVTRCKSCDTVDMNIVDRCKYCGSQRVEVKSVDESLIGRSGKRYFLVNRKKKQDANRRTI